MQLCSSIQKLLLILPCDTSPLAEAIESRSSLSSFYDSPSSARNWYNLLLTRVLLLPAHDDPLTNDDIYQNFFATDGPQFVLATLSSSRKMFSLSDFETRLSWIESLFELSRFISLVMMTQTQIARANKHKKDTLEHLWSVMYKLDDFMYNLARSEAERFDPSLASPLVKPEFVHFEGIIQLAWQVTNMVSDHSLAEHIIHSYKLGLEMFVCFAAIAPLSKVQLNGQSFCCSPNFLEFIVQVRVRNPSVHKVRIDQSQYNV